MSHPIARGREAPPVPSILRPGPAAQEPALHAQLYTLLSLPTIPKQKAKTTTLVAVAVSTANPITTSKAPATNTTTAAITKKTAPTTTAGHATTSHTLSQTPSSGADAGGGSVANGSSSKSATGIVVGVTLGVLVIIAVIAGLILKRRRSTKRNGEQLGEAELKQQRRMIAGNTGDLFPARPASQQQRPQDNQDEHQPDWWRKKPTLEYYRQVPPIKELFRTTDTENLWQGQGQGQGYEATTELPEQGTPQAMTKTEVINRSSMLQGVGRDRRVSFWDHQSSPDQGHQHQQRVSQQHAETSMNGCSLSPIRPFSPIGSICPELPQSQLESTYIPPPPPVDKAFNPYYRPPPPTYLPILHTTRLSPAPRKYRRQPSAGFYDFFEAEQTSVPPRPTITRPNVGSATIEPAPSPFPPPPTAAPFPLPVPPPIPRATRPMSVRDTSVTALGINPPLDGGFVPPTSAPLPPPPLRGVPPPPIPVIFLNAADYEQGVDIGPRPQIRSPVRSKVLGFEGEPRMGGRMPRVAKIV